jgi:ribosomal protein L20A (L18A)
MRTTSIEKGYITLFWACTPHQLTRPGDCQQMAIFNLPMHERHVDLHLAMPVAGRHGVRRAQLDIHTLILRVERQRAAFRNTLTMEYRFTSLPPDPFMCSSDEKQSRSPLALYSDHLAMPVAGRHGVRRAQLDIHTLILRVERQRAAAR